MGVTFALLAMLSFATNIMITPYAMARMSVEAGFFIVLATNILFPALLFPFELAARAAPWSWDWKGAGLFALGGFVGTFLGRRFLFDAVRILGPSRASVFHSTAPAFALAGALSPAAARRGLFVGLMTVAGFGLGNVVRGLAMRNWEEAVFGTVISSMAALLCQVLATRDWPKIAAQLRAADRRAVWLYVACGVSTAFGSIFVALVVLAGIALLAIR